MEGDIRKEIDSNLSVLAAISTANHEGLMQVDKWEMYLLDSQQSILDAIKNRTAVNQVIQELKSQIKSFETYGALQVKSIRTPVKGTIHYLVESDYVKAGQVLAVIKRQRPSDIRKVIVASLPVKYFRDIRIGQVAYVDPPSSTIQQNRLLEGRVREITRIAEDDQFRDPGTG